MLIGLLSPHTIRNSFFYVLWYNKNHHHVTDGEQACFLFDLFFVLLSFRFLYNSLAYNKSAQKKRVLNS